MVVRTAVWSLLWIAGTRVNQLAFLEAMTEGQPITSTATLLSSIAYSVALSVVAGYGAALLEVPHHERALNYHRTLDLMEGIPRRTSPGKSTSPDRVHSTARTQRSRKDTRLLDAPL